MLLKLYSHFGKWSQIGLRKSSLLLQCCLTISALSACSSNDAKYNQTTVGEVHVCDLDTVDASQLLDFNIQQKELTSSLILSLYANDQIEWKETDINISRCKPKMSPDSSRALRIFIPKEKWTEGFQFTYDLYFDADDQLTAIEARHRYIGRNVSQVD